MMIKLSDWCEKNGIKYLTGYRWFKDGKMPVQTMQTDSGTILVSDTDETDNSEPKPLAESPISRIIKKAIEIGKANGSVEDLAAFVIMNFSLTDISNTAHSSVAGPVKKQGVKPTKEMTENHFKKLMKQDKVRPETNMFIINQNDFDSVVAASENESVMNTTDVEKFGKVVPYTNSLLEELKSMTYEMSDAINQGTNESNVNDDIADVAKK